ncbi:MAG TPA: suppressor of fused domain protein [Pyrinomonadaceae bacterium]|nr:suppressor of fused domain protein [Pyrinomonadaceae bacterium]
MTEEELRQHILSATDRPGRGEQPPFAEFAFPLHPSRPIDYELVRAQMYERILGPCDGVFHPPTGAPHIDVCRYPPTSARPFWCYVTNGMSDFRQILPDDSWYRSEIMCASASQWDSAAELLQVLGRMPFEADTYLREYHTVPFPQGIEDPKFTYIMTIPPFLVKEFDGLSFLDEPLEVMSVIRITSDEREFAVEHSSRELVDNLPDELDTWLIDGRSTPLTKPLH